jgi:hypothetical protein
MGGDAPSRTPSSYPTLVERPVGQRISAIYRDRLRQFTDTGQFKEQNLASYGYFCPIYVFLHIFLHVLLRHHQLQLVWSLS